MKIINKKRVVTINCTDYNNETLFLGYSTDVNSTLLCFLINREYLGDNFNYRVVFSRNIAGEADKSIYITDIDIENGTLKCTLPAAITHYSDTDSQQGHNGILQLFIYEQSNSQNNETSQVELVATSSKFPYIIGDSLNLEAISSVDIDINLWTDLEDAANKIKNSNFVKFEEITLSELNNKNEPLDEETIYKIKNYGILIDTNTDTKEAQYLFAEDGALRYRYRQKINGQWEAWSSDFNYLVDLSDYYKKNQVDAALMLKADKNSVHTKEEVDIELDCIDPVLERSDNLFYFTDVNNRTVGGLTLEFLSNSSVKVSGTSNGNQYIGIMGGVDAVGPGVVTNAPNTYTGEFVYSREVSGTFSGEGTGATFRYGANGDKGIAFNNGIASTLDGDYLSFRFSSGTFNDFIIEIMVVEGSVAKDFIPYDEAVSAIDHTARDDISDINADIAMISETNNDNLFYFTSTATRILKDASNRELTISFPTKSSIEVNGDTRGYQFIGIMGGTSDNRGSITNTCSTDTYSGTFSVRFNRSGEMSKTLSDETVVSNNPGAELHYGDSDSGSNIGNIFIGNNTNDRATVEFTDKYFNFRIKPGHYDHCVFQLMLTSSDTSQEFVSHDTKTAVDMVARRNSLSPSMLIGACDAVSPKKILTWIDDDTSGTGSIQAVIDICQTLGIRCTFASITGNLTSAVIELLKTAQNSGFHVCSHGHSSHSTWRTSGLDVLDGDLALSISTLQENGFLDSNMIVYPGSVVTRSDIDITTIARKWCMCGVQDFVSKRKYFNGYGSGRYLINRKFIPKWTSNSGTYTEHTAEEYEAFLDALSENEAPWVVFGTHSSHTTGDHPEFDATLVTDVFTYALNNGWTIMTLNEAFKYRERYYRIQEMFGLN